MNNEVKLKGLAGLAHLLSPGADWAYDDAARNVRDYVKEQTLALAAKDAEIEQLKRFRNSLLHTIADVQQTLGFTSDEMSVSNGSLEMVEAIRELREDTARLDKLPQCFHMLRHRLVEPERPHRWWLTYAPNNVYSSVREAIDAHKGTPE